MFRNQGDLVFCKPKAMVYLAGMKRGFTTLLYLCAFVFFVDSKLSAQCFDPETGHYYMRHRYYSPETGRYIQPDPNGVSVNIRAVHRMAMGYAVRAQDMHIDMSPWAVAGGIGNWAHGQGNTYDSFNCDPWNRSDPYGLGLLEWIIMGEEDPSQDQVEAVKRTWIESLIPLPGGGSVGQWLYTNESNPSQEALKAASKVAGCRTDCVKDCLIRKNQEAQALLAALAASGASHGGGIPKILAGQKVAEGASRFTSGARLLSMQSAKLFGAGSKMHSYFQGIARDVKGNSLKAMVRGAVVAIAAAETYFAVQCAKECSK